MLVAAPADCITWAPTARYAAHWSSRVGGRRSAALAIALPAAARCLSSSWPCEAAWKPGRPLPLLNTAQGALLPAAPAQQGPMFWEVRMVWHNHLLTVLRKVRSAWSLGTGASHYLACMHLTTLQDGTRMNCLCNKCTLPCGV